MLCTQDRAVHASRGTDNFLDEITRMQKLRQRTKCAPLFFTRLLDVVALPFRLVASVLHHDLINAALCTLPQIVGENGVMQEAVNLRLVGGRKGLHNKNGAARQTFQNANSLLHWLRGTRLAVKAVAHGAVRADPPPPELLILDRVGFVKALSACPFCRVSLDTQQGIRQDHRKSLITPRRLIPTRMPHDSIRPMSTTAAERPIFARKSWIGGKQAVALVDVIDDGKQHGFAKILGHEPVTGKVQEQR
jgi:hypothetical protein